MKRTFIFIVHQFILMLEMPNTPYDPTGENRERGKPMGLRSTRDTEQQTCALYLGRKLI